jgi:RsiW-degrading membrane proteinase PrsW (M82 family)
MVRNSNPGRGMSDGTPLGFIQQVLFEEEQQRKQYGNNGNDDLLRHEQLQHQQVQQRQQEQEHYYDEEAQVNVQPQSILKKRNNVESNEFVEPIPDAVPALQEPKIQMNFTNTTGKSNSTAAAFVKFLIYTFIFSFIIFVVLYIRQYITKKEPKNTALELLTLSLIIGVIVSVVIYFTQNKIIKT